MHLAGAHTKAVTLFAECVLISVTTQHYTTHYSNMFSAVCIYKAAPYFKCDELGKDSCFLCV